MSIAFEPQPSDRPDSATGPRAASADGLDLLPSRHQADVEAPEAAELDREAPETRIVRGSEAPDAGEGRLAHIEHEFTHGRSRS